jgi:hypothetical protein
MITVKEADKSLSLKISDYKADNGDGSLFDFEDRLRYLRRGYSRLLRNLRNLMRQYAPTFANSREYLNQVVSNAEQQTGIGIDIYNSSGNAITIEKIEELFIKVKQTKNSGDEEAQTASTTLYNGKATYISPDKYLSVKAEVNDMYNPTKEYFYTILSNKIYLLPLLTSSTKYYSEIDVVCLKDSENFDLDDTLYIPNEFIDLFITMAASEAMQDLARSDKVGLYNQDITTQLTILKGYADLKESLKGSDTDG